MDLFPCSRRVVLLLLAVWFVPTLSIAALSLDPTHVWFGTDQVRLLADAERVLDGEPALLGAYSREGVRHPGPFYTYLLAAMHGPAGREPRLTQAMVGVVQASAPLILGLLCVRVSGLPLLAVWVPWVCLVGWPGIVFGRIIWNPSMMVPLAALTLWMALEVTAGSRWALVVLVGAASALAQVHLATLPMAVALSVAAMACVAVDRATRTAGWSAWRAPAVGSIVLLVILWLPVVIDAVRHRGGNIRDLWTLAGGATGHSTIAEAWAPIHTLLTATFPAPRGHATLALAVAAALFAASAITLRRRHPPVLRYAGLVAIAWLALLATLVRSPVPLESYYLAFVDVLAAATLIGTATGVLLLASGRVRQMLLLAMTIWGVVTLAPRVVTEGRKARDPSWNAFPLADFQQLASAIRAQPRQPVALTTHRIRARLGSPEEHRPEVQRSVSFPLEDHFALAEPLTYVLRRMGVELHETSATIPYRVRRAETRAGGDDVVELGRTRRLVLERVTGRTTSRESELDGRDRDQGGGGEQLQ